LAEAPAVSAPPAPPPREEDEVVEIDLEDDGFVPAADVEGEEELFIEVEGEEEVEAPASEPATVADALAIIRHGAPQRGAEFLEEHLGGDPGDVEAWQALIEARGMLGDSHGVRDGLLRLASQFRRAARFEDARAAYRGALDADPRSEAAARGLADLLIEEQAAVAPPPVALADSEEEISIDLFDQADGETSGEPEPEVSHAPGPGPAADGAPVAAEAAVEEVSLDDAAPEAQPISQFELEEFAFDDVHEESADFGAQGAEPPPPPLTAAPVPPIATAAPGETGTSTGTSTGAGMDELEEFLAEADFYFQQGLVDEAEFLYTKLLKLAPGHPVVTRQLRKLEERRGPTQVVPEAAVDVKPDEEPVAASAPGSVADFSDFLSGLDQEMGLPPIPEPFAAPPPLGEDGLSEIFQEFQRSVKEQLGDEDFETHYNLGIAYKEMGLMEEGIAEFTLAEKNPTRRLNAISMIALCLREMGRFDEAALKLRTGISLAVEGSEDQKGFLYDLATLHEQAGRATDAQDTLRRLLDIDPGYRDVVARVGAAPPAASTAPRKKSKVSYL
jgi:tetratricopeptide (TPR) repeat protein